MTIKELKEIMSQYDDEAEVMLHLSDDDKFDGKLTNFYSLHENEFKFADGKKDVRTLCLFVK